jgi:spiro-SPASM protein
MGDSPSKKTALTAAFFFETVIDGAAGKSNDKSAKSWYRTCMNALMVLFGGYLQAEAFSGAFGGQSALDRSLLRGAAFPGVEKVCLFIRENGEPPPLPRLPVPLELVQRPAWDTKTLLDALSTVSGGFDFAYYAWADSPFLDPRLAGAIAERHLRYPADYSYADGYAYGFAPEIVSPETAAILGKLLDKDAKLGTAKVSRDSVFQVLQKDINSFDIETEVASIDHRPYRLSFTADSKRNLLLCQRFFDEGIDQAEDSLLFTERVIKEKPHMLRTLPAFFSVQVTDRCPVTPSCALCPYAPLSARSGGTEMAVSDFALLLDKIVSYAGDAVIDLSLWGEPALHNDRGALIEAVLARPALSLVIETAIANWDETEIAAYADKARAAPPRHNGMASLSWIVSALSPTGDDPEPRSVFQTYFPADSYHQMIRVKGNEDAVETFYRYWKGRGAQVLIQKYDCFGGILPLRATADLSPFRRHPCWHIMRDFPVLLDGGVPWCREDLDVLTGKRAVLGNAFTEPLEAIGERNEAAYREHCGGVFRGICDTCDEWYTYNF